MKQGIFILSLLIMSSCSTTGSDNRANFEGVWVWEDVDVTQPELVLKKHVLNLQRLNFEEAYFENSTPRGREEGTLLVSRDNDTIEFATTGNVQTVYKGYLSGNTLVINSINDKVLNPPALYKRQ